MAVMNATVVRFCNEHIRPICDLYAKLIARARIADEVYWAEQMATLMGADGNETIGDGSGANGDGRPTLTVDQAKNVLTQVLAIRTAADANGGAIRNVFLAGAVNPLP